MKPDTIQQLLEDPATRAEVVAALSRLVESEVAEAPGTRGAAARRAYAHVTRRRPELVARGVAAILDDWLVACAEDYDFPLTGKPGELGAYIAFHHVDLGDRLLDVVERRLESSSSRWARMVRPMLPRRTIRDAVPRVWQVVQHSLAPAWSAQPT